MKKTGLGILFVSILSSSTLYAMTELDDNALSQVEGQALLNLTYNQGINSGSMQQSNMGFYRLGLAAELSLNANIKKLQLGCGGSKGAERDIDIDNIALTGINPVDGSYVNSDFVLNNPFIEFAIDNPNSAATRQVAGFRLGALSALGMMSIGGNSDLSKLNDDKGINSLSGDIGVRVTNANIKGIQVTLLGLPISTADAKVTDYATTLVVNRSSTFDLLGMDANSTLNIAGYPLLKNLHLDTNMKDIPFSTVHRLVIADSNGGATSNASLSLQNKDIFWQNVTDNSWKANAAQKGWWMSIPDTQFANLNMDGSNVKLPISSAVGGLLGATVNIDPMDLGQLPISNCYGGLKFC
ncbi:MAG TPA: hypothetical protein DDX00_01160 [Acinetobacter radioresistens]|nr:hypothetical protein [Acinetobacter radioresistens]